MRNNGPGEAQQPPIVEYNEIAKMRQSLRDIHEKTGSWRFVGQVIGRSGAYARMIASEEREPTKAVIDQWRKYIKTTGKPPRKRRRYWRPCLSDALGRELAAAGYTTTLVELVLWRALKAEREEDMP